MVTVIVLRSGRTAGWLTVISTHTHTVYRCLDVVVDIEVIVPPVPLPLPAPLGSGADSGTDNGTDSGPDSGTDNGTDSGTDNGTDNGTDSGTDSGTDREGTPETDFLFLYALYAPFLSLSLSLFCSISLSEVMCMTLSKHDNSGPT